MQWFAQVDGQIYGPYADEQMQGFVAEGRINGQSLISNNPSAGFYPAIGYDVFSLWSGTGQAAQVSTAYTEPAQMAVGFGGQTSHARSHSGQYSTPVIEQPGTTGHQFIIMAEIRSDGLMGFLQRLQTFGQAERLGESVWALRSSQSTESLRNALSQTLTRQDRLFIVDSVENKTAWFNIGADLDKRIRTLWDEEAG